jgi:hypothetical protein
MRSCWLLLLLVACPASEPKGGGRWTQSGRYLLDIRLLPDPPPLGELFQVEVTVRTSEGLPIETAKVKVDARMPQHNHGMETRPRTRPGECSPEGVCRHPGGVYVVDGFKFHMTGTWTVTVEVDGPKGPDSTSVPYDLVTR